MLAMVGSVELILEKDAPALSIIEDYTGHGTAYFVLGLL